MLQINYLRQNKEKAIKGLQKRHFPDAESKIEQAINLDDQRKKAQTALDNALSLSKQYANEIGALMKEGKKEEANQKKDAVATLKNETKQLQDGLIEVEKQLNELLYLLPNIPHESVPEGKTPEDNEVVLEGGTVPTLSAEALPHWELIKKYDLIDFELGNKITGAGFPVYKGKGAKLQRALVQFFLDEAEKAGYLEIQPPIVINKDSGFGTGQLPDKEGQMYYIPQDDLYLIPTAEVPITNLYRDEIIEKTALPIRNVGYTPCFRREAGSWGAHVRGLNRLHQFDKVEIVQIQLPEKSYETLLEMRNHVEKLLQKLQLPYRILRLCGGDMGFTSALTYDFEVFSAAQQRWLEVSSVSNFETFQANRLKLRYREEDKKTTLLHTLNGSALALPRIMAAILENNQEEKGIVIPEVLHYYTQFTYIGG